MVKGVEASMYVYIHFLKRISGIFPHSILWSYTFLSATPYPHNFMFFLFQKKFLPKTNKKMRLKQKTNMVHNKRKHNKPQKSVLCSPGHGSCPGIWLIETLSELSIFLLLTISVTVPCI